MSDVVSRKEAIAWFDSYYEKKFVNDSSRSGVEAWGILRGAGVDLVDKFFEHMEEADTVPTTQHLEYYAYIYFDGFLSGISVFENKFRELIFDD